MKKIRLTESDLTRIVKRIISEQSKGNDFIDKGFKVVKPKGNLGDFIIKAKNKFGFGEVTAYYREKDKTYLICDEKQVMFLSVPISKDFRDLGFQVGREYKIKDVLNKI